MAGLRDLNRLCFQLNKGRKRKIKETGSGRKRKGARVGLKEKKILPGP